MSVLLKNHNFTTRFSVSVLSFFNRNLCFSLIYTKNLGICVRTTEKLPTSLICVKQSLNLMLGPLKFCKYTIHFSMYYKYYGGILQSLVIYVQKFTQFVLGFLTNYNFPFGVSVYQSISINLLKKSRTKVSAAKKVFNLINYVKISYNICYVN